MDDMSKDIKHNQFISWSDQVGASIRDMNEEQRKKVIDEVVVIGTMTRKEAEVWVDNLLKSNY